MGSRQRAEFPWVFLQVSRWSGGPTPVCIRKRGSPTMSARGAQPHHRERSAECTCDFRLVDTHGHFVSSMRRSPMGALGPTGFPPRAIRRIRFAALPDRRTARNEEPVEIPVGGPYPARQPLRGQGMIGRRTDEVEPQGLDEPLAHRGRIGGRGLGGRRGIRRYRQLRNSGQPTNIVRTPFDNCPRMNELLSTRGAGRRPSRADPCRDRRSP